MKRGEFMMRLSVLLNDIPEEEKTDALKFYNNYFDDAGPENEENVIGELGSPEKVAQSIKESISEDDRTSGKEEDIFHSLVSSGTEDWQKQEERENRRRYQQGDWASVRQSRRNDQRGSQSKCEGGYQRESQNQYQSDDQREPQGRYGSDHQRKDRKQEPESSRKMSRSTITLIVILAVFASPILLGLASGGFGILLGILACVFAVLFAFGVGALAFFLGGIGCLILGIMRCLTSPVHAVMICGVGMLLLAIGFLFCIVMGFMWGKVFPSCVNAIRRLCKKIFRRRSEA